MTKFELFVNVSLCMPFFTMFMFIIAEFFHFISFYNYIDYNNRKTQENLILFIINIALFSLMLVLDYPSTIIDIYKNRPIIILNNLEQFLITITVVSSFFFYPILLFYIQELILYSLVKLNIIKSHKCTGIYQKQKLAPIDKHYTNQSFKIKLINHIKNNKYFEKIKDKLVINIFVTILSSLFFIICKFVFDIDFTIPQISITSIFFLLIYLLFIKNETN